MIIYAKVIIYSLYKTKISLVWKEKLLKWIKFIFKNIKTNLKIKKKNIDKKKFPKFDISYFINRN